MKYKPGDKVIVVNDINFIIKERRRVLGFVTNINDLNNIKKVINKVCIIETAEEEEKKIELDYHYLIFECPNYWPETCLIPINSKYKKLKEQL